LEKFENSIKLIKILERKIGGFFEENKKSVELCENSQTVNKEKKNLINIIIIIMYQNINIIKYDNIEHRNIICGFIITWCA
jgi:hypothetical protein